jgi:hypothetical protein
MQARRLSKMTKTIPFTQAGLKRAIASAQEAGLHGTGEQSGRLPFQRLNDGALELLARGAPAFSLRSIHLLY